MFSVTDSLSLPTVTFAVKFCSWKVLRLFFVNYIRFVLCWIILVLFLVLWSSICLFVLLSFLVPWYVVLWFRFRYFSIVGLCEEEFCVSSKVKSIIFWVSTGNWCCWGQLLFLLMLVREDGSASYQFFFFILFVLIKLVDFVSILRQMGFLNFRIEFDTYGYWYTFLSADLLRHF